MRTLKTLGFKKKIAFIIAFIIEVCTCTDVYSWKGAHIISMGLVKYNRNVVLTQATAVLFNSSVLSFINYALQMPYFDLQIYFFYQTNYGCLTLAFTENLHKH